MQNGEIFVNKKLIEIIFMRNYKKCGKELGVSSWENTIAITTQKKICI